jgi:predicted RNA polymerase sigma factor
LVTTLDQVFREEWGRVLATLIGFLGDFDLAEEAAQEAFAIAADRWPRDGVPSNPRAWLMTTARNHATDRTRRSPSGGFRATPRRNSRSVVRGEPVDANWLAYEGLVLLTTYSQQEEGRRGLLQPQDEAARRRAR